MMAAVTIRLVLTKISYKSSPMKPLDLIKHVYPSTSDQTKDYKRGI